MAEQVQAILERMVPYLKDLRDRGLFSPEEIRAIVARRRQSEYLLQRRSSARKSDFLRYIEEEVLLERLRKLRKERVLTARRNERASAGSDTSDEEDGDDTRRKKKKRRKHAYQSSGPGDSHIISHVHFLYQRTLRKFHHPLDVILSYAEFAKEHKSFHVLSRVYAEGLQHHPREAGLWVEAASFEYFGYVAQDYEQGKGEDEVHTKVAGGGSIKTARVLLQRGLRINRTHPELWLQYFALELHYMQKLRGRKAILEPGGSDDEDDASNARALLPSQIIFKNAIKAVSADVRFRLRFVEVCRMFPRTAPLEERVMESVARDFGASVPGWVARISYAEEQRQRTSTEEEEDPGDAVGFLAGTEDAEESEEADGAVRRPRRKAHAGQDSDASGEAPELRLLRDALAAVPTAVMYLEGSRFLQARIQRLLEHDQNATEGEEEDVAHLLEKGEDARGAARRHFRLLEQLYAQADEKEISSVHFTLDRAEHLLRLGQKERANALLSAASESAADARGDGALLWLRWADVALSPVRVLRQALTRTPMHERRAHSLISQDLMRRLMAQPVSPTVSDELQRLFQKVLLLSRGAEHARPARALGRADNEGAGEAAGDEHDRGEPNPAAAFVAYLEHTLRHGTEGDVRSVYTTVLYGSNYGATCAGKTEEELAYMKVFFDACLAYELDQKKSGKEETKASRGRLRKLYNAGMEFYRSGGSAWGDVVAGYEKDLQEMKYSF